MAQVVSLSAEIEALNTNIIAISFGTPQWVDGWRQVTGATFPIWLDPTKASYQAYGLTSSAMASWGVKNLWYYARALARGEKLQEKRGDTHQLGGNFIVDQQGIVRLAYASKDPTDRPAIDLLLSTLGQVK